VRYNGCNGDLRLKISVAVDSMAIKTVFMRDFALRGGFFRWKGVSLPLRRQSGRVWLGRANFLNVSSINLERCNLCVICSLHTYARSLFGGVLSTKLMPVHLPSSTFLMNKVGGHRQVSFQFYKSVVGDGLWDKVV